PATAEVVAALATDDGEADTLARRFFALPHVHRRLADVGVERATQTLVAREDHQHHGLFFAPREQRMHVLDVAESFTTRRVRYVGRDVLEHVADAFGVRPQRHDTLLRAGQSRARHQLHRPRDLLRRLDAGNAFADLFQVRHGNSGRNLVNFAWLHKRCRRSRSYPAVAPGGLARSAARVYFPGHVKFALFPASSAQLAALQGCCEALRLLAEPAALARCMLTRAHPSFRRCSYDDIAPRRARLHPDRGDRPPRTQRLR